MLHHIVNEHEWIGGECGHQPLTEAPTDGSGNIIPYFHRKEAAFKTLQKIVTDKAWMKSLKVYTKFRYMYSLSALSIIILLRHTGALEYFHSMMLGYCSKRTAYQ